MDMAKDNRQLLQKSTTKGHYTPADVSTSII